MIVGRAISSKPTETFEAVPPSGIKNALNSSYNLCVREHIPKLSSFSQEHAQYLAEKRCNIEQCGVPAFIVDTPPPTEAMIKNKAEYTEFMLKYLKALNLDVDDVYGSGEFFFSIYPMENIGKEQMNQQVIVLNTENLEKTNPLYSPTEFKEDVEGMSILKFFDNIKDNPQDAYKKLINGFITLGKNTGIDPMEALAYALKQVVSTKLRYPSHPVDITQLIDEETRVKLANFIRISPQKQDFFIELSQRRGRQIYSEKRDCGVFQYITFKDIGNDNGTHVTIGRGFLVLKLFNPPNQEL